MPGFMGASPYSSQAFPSGGNTNSLFGGGGFWTDPNAGQRIQAQGAYDVAGINAQAQQKIAQTQAEAQKYGYGTALQGQLAGYGSQQQIAQTQLSGQLAGYQSAQDIATGEGQVQLAGQQSQRDIAAQQAQTQLAGYQSQQDIARTQAQAAEYAPTLAQQRFNTVFPFVQQQFGTLSNAIQGAGAGGTGTGGYNAQGQPNISAAPIWNQGQIQQQVNTMRAQNDAQAAGQTRASRQALAGRGIGGNSPLMDALQAQYQGQALQANTAGEQSTRFNAAQGNAQQQLSGQQAQEQQYASRQGEQIQRQRTLASQQNALLAALSGLAA